MQMPEGLAKMPSLGAARSIGAPCDLRCRAKEESALTITHASPCSKRLKACGICVYTVSRLGFSLTRCLKPASGSLSASAIGLPVARGQAMNRLAKPSVFCREGRITRPLNLGSQTSDHEAIPLGSALELEAMPCQGTT